VPEVEVHISVLSLACCVLSSFIVFPVKKRARTVVLLAPGVQAVSSTEGDGDVEGLTGDTAESVEDSLVQGAGKGTLLIGRKSVDGNTALLGGAQMSPPTHPFS